LVSGPFHGYDGDAALAFHVKHASAGYNFRKFAALFHEAEQVAKAGWHRAAIANSGS
jgi:hypothetical protein